jgi:hypothetical protein
MFLLLLVANLAAAVMGAFLQPHTLQSFAFKERTIPSAQRYQQSAVYMSDKDWDAILADDDADDLSDYNKNIPRDMQYSLGNCQRQQKNFVAIRDAGGADVCNDIYVRDPVKDPQTFWYAGKVARVSDVSLEDCVARQWPLIELHAANLRPLDLYASRGALEIWTAPGDSELSVAYNRPNVVMKKMNKNINAKVKSNLIGFQGEVYDKGEEGFRTLRKEDGTPVKPEIQYGAQEETRPPTDEEMEKLEEAMQNSDVDISELYKEQQRREGNIVED